jgi:hypothetical protein
MEIDEIDHVATITISEAGEISVAPDPIQTIPGKAIVFVIVNNHGQEHKVSVSPFHFHRKPDSRPDAPDHPIDLFAKFWDDVDAEDAGAFQLRVRDKGDFPSGSDDTRPFRYKYTIAAKGLPDYDPDLEINN